MSWPNPSCASCGADLPERGYKLHPVPWRGTRRRQVCEDCRDSELIGGQGQLFEPASETAGADESRAGYSEPPERPFSRERAA